MRDVQGCWIMGITGIILLRRTAKSPRQRQVPPPQDLFALPALMCFYPPNPIIMQPAPYQKLSTLCFYLGFASIAASILIWFLTGGSTPESQAHAERFGIFVGLWAPTFFILSNRFSRYADHKP